jgi:DNA-binding PadR family transcriptional regulator
MTAVDLSCVFGAAAAALPRRRRDSRRPRRARDPEPDPVEPETREDTVPGTRGPRAPVAAGPAPAALQPVSRLPDAPAARRRSRVVPVRDRGHVDMLLLAAATEGPANGQELIGRVGERSHGLFVLSPRVVIHQLHRLASNRLVRVVGDGRVRRYALTPLGERVLATRRREWEIFSRGFDRALDSRDAPRDSTPVTGR